MTVASVFCTGKSAGLRAVILANDWPHVQYLIDGRPALVSNQSQLWSADWGWPSGNAACPPDHVGNYTPVRDRGTKREELSDCGTSRHR